MEKKTFTAHATRGRRLNSFTDEPIHEEGKNS